MLSLPKNVCLIADLRNDGKLNKKSSVVVYRLAFGVVLLKGAVKTCVFRNILNIQLLVSVYESEYGSSVALYGERLESFAEFSYI